MKSPLSPKTENMIRSIYREDNSNHFIVIQDKELDGKDIKDTVHVVNKGLFDGVLSKSVKREGVTDTQYSNWKKEEGICVMFGGSDYFGITKLPVN